MSEAPMPVEVFCSYAHEDEAWLRKLEAHLSVLERQGLIQTDWINRAGKDYSRSKKGPISSTA